MSDFLILGAGWTSGFLIPALQAANISYSATTRSGSNNTIPFAFDPDLSDDERKLQFSKLPDASTVLITFPLTGERSSSLLVTTYFATRTGPIKARFIQLGTTSIWGGVPRKSGQIKIKGEHKWYDRKSPYDRTERVKAEEELLSLAADTTVLNLAGLYGGTRQLKNWISNVAPSKEVAQDKGSLHLIHGIDLARAIIAVHQDFSKVTHQRWLLTNCRIYDWWDLIAGFFPQSTSSPDGLDRASWIREFMRQEGIRALPRPPQMLGRALDSTEFWELFHLSPMKTSPFDA